MWLRACRRRSCGPGCCCQWRSSRAQPGSMSLSWGSCGHQVSSSGPVRVNTTVTPTFLWNWGLLAFRTKGMTHTSLSPKPDLCSHICIKLSESLGDLSPSFPSVLNFIRALQMVPHYVKFQKTLLLIPNTGSLTLCLSSAHRQTC
jgi:hypothetical protein